MPLLTVQRNPDDRQLRQFGLIACLALPLAGWWWGGSAGTMGALGVGGAVLAGLAWFRPQWLKFVFVGLSLSLAPIGWVVGELAMLLIYFAVILPVGIWIRVFGGDPLSRRSDADATTYYHDKRQPKDASSYYRQF